MDVWKLPDILIIQLKRFRYTSGGISKINNLIEFPLTALDAKELMKAYTHSIGYTVSDAPENQLYDLYGVVNHTGNVSSGHYTSYAISLLEEEWLYFDDSRLHKLQNSIESQIITPKAYMLFYKRRRFNTSNLVNFKTF